MPIENAALVFEARAGEPVVVELRSLPGAGLLWSPQGSIEGCDITQLDTRPDGAGVGGHALQRFQIQCGSEGVRHVRFELKRPWEPTVRTIQDVEIRISAR